jgi:type II secretory pathway pseudopilin PulG
MIVVSIIALLAVIAVPSFLRARQRSQNAKFINALRVAADAIDLYAMENPGRYPADVTPGVVPPELVGYLDQTMDWAAVTPIGGNWDWDFNALGIKAGVAVAAPSAGLEQLTEIDRQFDDGDLTTGRFRITSAGTYRCTIEE